MDGYFDLELQPYQENKYDDVFLIKSDEYETIKCNDDQLINLLVQILAWQETWHKEYLKNCVPHEDPEDVEGEKKSTLAILNAIDTLLKLYLDKKTYAELKESAYE
jgi:hypothetical protein